MSDRKHVFEWFHPLEPEDIKAARTITIRLEGGEEAEVDDERNWFADDEAVFDKVVPVANNWPDDDYYPLRLLRAHALATWVAKELRRWSRRSRTTSPRTTRSRPGPLPDSPAPGSGSLHELVVPTGVDDLGNGHEVLLRAVGEDRSRLDAGRRRGRRRRDRRLRRQGRAGHWVPPEHQLVDRMGDG